MSEETYFVKFKTSLGKEFEITNEIITIPRDLKRLGISQVINHLLGTSENPTPFDVSINKELLRSSLRKYVATNGYDEEQVIEIEYMFAFASSTEENEFKHDDWVSAIDKHTLAHTGFILTGCYDSIIRMWDTVTKSSEASLFLKGHTAPIKALSSFTNATNSNELTLVSASQDQTLKVWNVDTSTKRGRCSVTFVGHNGSVEDCDIHKNGDLIVSGSYDQTIKLWSITGETEEIEGDAETKKRKVGETGDAVSDQKKKRAIVTLSGHKQAVSGVKWLSKNEIISSSYDFSIKIWDTMTNLCAQTLEGNSVMTGISNMTENSIVTAHADRSVRFWDRREGSQKILSSHTGWVSCVSCFSNEPNMFITGGYDGVVKVWDIRSVTPLHSTDAHPKNKVLTVRLSGKNIFSSGGTDNILKTHSIS